MDFLDLDLDYGNVKAMDKLLDHELDALIKVLRHNLHINGHPIDDDYQDEN